MMLSIAIDLVCTEYINMIQRLKQARAERRYGNRIRGYT